MTKVQEHILDIVLQSKGHMNAEQILKEVKKQFPKVATGTIYRNLNLFADTKEIKRVQRADGPDYFESNIVPHDHSICIHCGQMFDIKIPDLKDYLCKNMNVKIVSFDLVVNCICPSCSNTTE